MSKHHKHGSRPKSHADADAREPNEGEGSRTAARAYNEDLRSFIDEKRVEPAAKEAKDFVDGNPAEAAADEDKAKAGPAPIMHRIGELASEGRAMFDRVQERVRGMIRRRLHRS